MDDNQPIPAPLPNDSLSTWVTKSIFGSIVLAIIITNIAIHYRASYSFPTPWPDESHFLWQSIAFQKTNSLSSPVLNPERTIYWMPPGYFIVMGTIFKLTGVSLGIARTISLIMFIIAFVLLAYMLSRIRFAVSSLCIAGLFFINSYSIMCGNIARMEALLLVMVFTAYILLIKKQFWKGLALLAVSPLIHFNGIYFIAAYIMTTLLAKEVRTSIPRPTMTDIGLLAVAGVAWLGYGWYVADNWSSVYHDMAYQFSRKSSRDIIGYMFTPASIVFIILTIASLAYATYKQLSVLPLLVLAVFFWLVNRVGHEMWYEILESLAYLFLTIGVIHITYDFSSHLFEKWSYMVKLLLPFLAGIVLVWWGYQRNYIEDMIHYPQHMNGWTMKLPETVPYITDADRKKIKGMLTILPTRQQPYLIQFQPRADAFFFLDIDTTRFQIIHPTFCDLKPDIYILHSSRYLPDWWIKHARNDMIDARVSYRHNNALLFARDKTERWYFRIMAAGRI